MSWVHLTIDDLRKNLSEDEILRLDELSKNDLKVEEMINSQLDLVSDLYRGAFLGKGYKHDIRPHYTPPEYTQIILDYARYSIWSRFPNSKEVALDEPREKAYLAALDFLKNPSIGTSDPDWPYSSENPINQIDPYPESESDQDIVKDSILDEVQANFYVQYLRFPTVPLYLERIIRRGAQK